MRPGQGIWPDKEGGAATLQGSGKGSEDETEPLVTAPHLWMSISLQCGNVCAGLPGYGCFSGLE